MDVGHLKSGAGAASLAKVILGLERRTLFPTANYEEPNEELAVMLASGSLPYRIQTEAEPYSGNGPFRAAASADFSFAVS